MDKADDDVDAPDAECGRRVVGCQLVDVVVAEEEEDEERGDDDAEGDGGGESPVAAAAAVVVCAARTFRGCSLWWPPGYRECRAARLTVAVE